MNWCRPVPSLNGQISYELSLCYPQRSSAYINPANICLNTSNPHLLICFQTQISGNDECLLYIYKDTYIWKIALVCYCYSSDLINTFTKLIRVAFDCLYAATVAEQSSNVLQTFVDPEQQHPELRSSRKRSLDPKTPPISQLFACMGQEMSLRVSVN